MANSMDLTRTVSTISSLIDLASESRKVISSMKEHRTSMLFIGWSSIDGAHCSHVTLLNVMVKSQPIQEMIPMNFWSKQACALTYSLISTNTDLPKYRLARSRVSSNAFKSRL